MQSMAALLIEQKCQQCRYFVMTGREIAELGCDPCETCDSDLCNWRPKQEVPQDGK